MSERSLTIAKNKPDEKLYQKRARVILPMLVRQAKRKKKITYGCLGQELGIHHRVLRYSLDCIGDTLLELGELRQEKIPPIQGLVVNKQTGLPGNNVNFLRCKKINPREEKKIVKAQLEDVFNYPKWLEVLDELGLSPAMPLNPQPEQTTNRRRGTSESEAHKRLKNYVTHHPQFIGLKKSLAPGKTEHVLRSRDRVDVFFENAHCSIAVEVKSHISDESDLERGLFQCVKYRAILKACRSLESGTYEVDALLAIEDSLSEELTRVSKTLGVRVIENILVSDNI